MKRPGQILMFAAAAAVSTTLVLTAHAGANTSLAVSSLNPALERCATQDPNLETQLRVQMQLARRGLGVSPVVIPVYWHVVDRGTALADGNISQELIEDQIEILNDAFSGGAGGAASVYQFDLIDVDRTTNEDWFLNANDPAVAAVMKAALHEGGANALNIFSCKPTNLLGRSTFPWQYAANPSGDGVILRFSSMPGGAATPFNEGDTLVHEVGHWMGLLHTFVGKCSTNNDFVGDTPAEKYPASGCPAGIDTCNKAGLDPVENYMDYSDDFCIYKFTAGQVQRMDAAWAAYRAP